MRTWLATSYVVLAFAAVQVYVPDPYMDEYFHVSQTKQYVRGHWLSWDPKITTPPGLYLLGTAISKVTGHCNVTILRAINLVGLLIISALATKDWKRHHRRNQIHPGHHQHDPHNKHLWAAVMTFPLLQFYANLYYTDVWGSLLVLAALNTTRTPIESVVLFTGSLLFRQTNVVWAAYAGISKYLLPRWNQLGIFRGSLDQLKAWGQWLPFAILGAAFLVFVHLNGNSIVLGDKSNHEVGLHFAQLLYFILFSGFMAAPIAVFQEGYSIQRYANIVRAELPRCLAEIAVIAAIIKFGTVVHPFILADNRHYPFYLWRRILHPSYFDGAEYLMVPVYHVLYRFFLSTLAHVTLYEALAYIGATAAVLVPTPLLEPRYYIVPYLVWRLQIYRGRCHYAELAWSIAIGGAAVVVFCVSNTHFMW